MNNISNKSSVYIQSLADFITDTKPFRCKLTDIIEEYQFSDSFAVKFTEAMGSKSLHKGAWLYNFFSGGNVNNRFFTTKRLVDPELVTTRSLVGSSEVTDLTGVPFVYDKKCFAGVGVANGWLDRGGVLLPYVEGLDYFQSHGSLELMVKQAGASPTWVESRVDTLVRACTNETQQLEQDFNRVALDPVTGLPKINPDTGQPYHLSVAWKLHEVVSHIRDYLFQFKDNNAAAQVGVAAAGRLIEKFEASIIPPAYTQTADGRVLSGDYDILLQAGATSGLQAPTPTPSLTPTLTWGWIGEDRVPADNNRYLDEALSALMPPLLFGMHGDSELYEDGSIGYDDVTSEWLAVKNIVTDPTMVEEWTLTAETEPNVWRVDGAITGYFGEVVAGQARAGRIAFDTVAGIPAVPGTKIVLTPRNRFSFSPTATQTTWNIIKVNPIAYTRPSFYSTRYGFISGVTLLDDTLPTGTVVLTATNSTTFRLTNTADVTHVGTASVGIPYSDGRISFLITAGTALAYTAGDKFLIQVQNTTASVADFDIYYGYDLDSYDNPGLSYDAPDADRPLDFWFDSRFRDYDVVTLGLTVAESVPDGRQFRMVAVPGVPFTPVDGVDIPALPAGMIITRASSFSVEYSDNGSTWTSAGVVPVDGSFSGMGVSFSVPAGSKPFVAVTTVDGVQGGDVIYFKVLNPRPFISNLPIGLMTSDASCRLVMHGDSYYNSIAASWTVTFTGPSTYVVEGKIAGVTLPGYPVTKTLLMSGGVIQAGASYQDDNVHFTIVPGRGFGIGDAFTFNTLAEKPSFLVYRGDSALNKPAVLSGTASYDKWFWNGEIGFKVRSAVAEVQYPVGHGWSPDHTKDVVATVRPDAPPAVYTFKKHPVDGWMVSRSDRGVIGHCTGTFKDQYISVAASNVGDFIVKVITDVHDFWNCADAVIVRSDISLLNPLIGDVVCLTKAEETRLGLQMDYSAVHAASVNAALQGLFPVGIDETMVSLSTSTNTRIAGISPETALFSNWIPTYTVQRDAAGSQVSFEDLANTISIYSAATNALIGTVSPLETALSEPTQFEFAADFFRTYLPLNSQVNLVVYDNGYNENVRVMMSERVNFLTSGGVLLENSLFQDAFSVTITEENFWNIDIGRARLNPLLDPIAHPIFDGAQDAIITAVSDGPFGGFLPGYANMPYEGEILGNVDQPVIPDGGFYDLAEGDASTLVIPEMGIPSVGLGIDIVMGLDPRRADVQSPDTDGAGTSITEAITIGTNINAISFDTYGFDTYGFDMAPIGTLKVFASSPHLPMSFDTFTENYNVDPPTKTMLQVTIFEVRFDNAAGMVTPTFTIDPNVAGGIAAIVPAVEKIGDGHYRFSISNPTIATITAS